MRMSRAPINHFPPNWGSGHFLSCSIDTWYSNPEMQKKKFCDVITSVLYATCNHNFKSNSFFFKIKINAFMDISVYFKLWTHQSCLVYNHLVAVYFEVLYYFKLLEAPSIGYLYLIWIASFDSAWLNDLIFPQYIQDFDPHQFISCNLVTFVSVSQC